jgi:hypothetical protein
MKRLIFVVSDSIKNSVFCGQVVAPLIKYLDNGIYEHIDIVSFEKSTIETTHIQHIANQHKHLHLIVVNTRPLIVLQSLRQHITLLKKILAPIPIYDIIARGALAGYISKRACNPIKCKKITIQARGLLAEEYAFTHKSHTLCGKWITRMRTHLYKTIERDAYTQHINLPCYIEVVSTALQQYLIKTYAADPNQCILATHDIPQKIDAHIIARWRSEIRAHLKIPHNAHVYCVSGSVKSWQCPNLIIAFFQKQYAKNSNAFLLILTQDIHEFYPAITALPPRSFHMTQINHKDVYRYLSAADVGLVFREPGIVSWVSRPIKALEYEAVGLKIIHNNTVHWLIHRPNTSVYIPTN